jgi:hypothetical protein
MIMILNNKTAKRRLLSEPTLVYQNNALVINREFNGEYSFEISNRVFITDIVEAVSYLIKHPKWRFESFWNLPVMQGMEVKPYKALYWLSGGDEVWRNPNFNVEWNEMYEEMLAVFEEDIMALFGGDTLGDIRDNIIENLNLDMFIEYIMMKKGGL